MTAQWSRLVRFVPASGSGPPAPYPAAEDPEPSEWVYGEPVDAEIDVGAALADGKAVEVEVLEGRVPWGEGGLRRTGKRATVGRLLSPLSREMAGMIRCVGLNYKDHAVCLSSASTPIPIPYGVAIQSSPKRETRVQAGCSKLT